MWPRCPKCDDLVGSTRTMKGLTRWCVSTGCQWREFTPAEPYDDTPWAIMRDGQPARPRCATATATKESSPTVYDERPGNYYVVAHPEAKSPQAGCYFVAGPYPSHRQACDMLRSVKGRAERSAASKVFGMRWITARTEIDDVRVTMLGATTHGLPQTRSAQGT